MTGKARTKATSLEAENVGANDAGQIGANAPKVARKRARVKVGGVTVTGDEATLADDPDALAILSDPPPFLIATAQSAGVLQFSLEHPRLPVFLSE